jgi:iron complex outermembrane recepter protein
MRLKKLVVAVSAATGGLTLTAQAQSNNDASIQLPPVVVTAPASTTPLEVVLDPKAPQQPIPANDGASFLKNIPGFSLIRKGGTDGDPVLRGSAGSRLNILLDGMEFHGGCSSRMDPPTAYVFPESYDEVTVIKGPQTVRYGNGNSAGVVLFDHNREDETPGTSGFASVLGGSFGRFDAVGNAKAVSDRTSLSATLTQAKSDNYKDGAGNEVHSAYERQSVTVLGGYKIDPNTRMDLDATVSRGEAAYADRDLDGSKFDRESYGLAFEKKNLSERVKKVSARVYHSYIDHVMDNYSLRTTTNCGGTGRGCKMMNPDRTTEGARLSFDLTAGGQDVLVGLDVKSDDHTGRMVMNGSLSAAQAVYSAARKTDYRSHFSGIFLESTKPLAVGGDLKYGLRADQWEGERHNSMSGAFEGSASETLASGFVRLERLHPSLGMRSYVGLGYSERPMDYWEARQKGGITSAGLVTLSPEKTLQLDTGAVWKGGKTTGSVSGFVAKVSDYILINGVSGTCSTAMATAGNGCSSNVDATRLGLEGDIRHRLAGGWSVWGSVAYVYAENDTMNVPLAQTPPLEVKLGSDYTTGNWTMGGVLRAVARQSRIHYNYGNIVGLDRANATPGFATLGINASYKPNKSSQVSFGIDNLFDRDYYEHISRTDQSISGYTVSTSTAINEPGRTLWVKAQANF